jgi:5-carboxymethyl-2-hydroxymuconate isomerase
MRLVSFNNNQQYSWGALLDNDVVVDLAAVSTSLKQAISDDKISSLNLDDYDSRLQLQEVKLLPPITNPEKIICIGVNYANRNEEYKDGSEPPKYPSVFMRTPDSLTAHGAPLIRPPESHKLDYEGEIVVVIGKRGRRIPQEEAYQHIAGLSIMNEGTLRDWVRHAKFNVTQGKNFVHSGSIGPWLVSADEFGPEQYENMRIKTRVNGELRQDDTTANMMFPIAYQIHYLSTFFELKPGDVIATGTPNGAGARFDPPRFLAPGDVVEVEVEGVGVLCNEVKDEVLK